MIRKCIFILATSCMINPCIAQTESNPFLTEFQTPFGAPPFDKIKLEHYEPAFIEGIKEQNAQIDVIINNSEANWERSKLLVLALEKGLETIGCMSEGNMC